MPKDEDLGSCPPFGTKAVWGLRYTMEDKWAAVPNMVQVPLDFAAPSQRSTALTALAGAAAACGCIGRGGLGRNSGGREREARRQQQQQRGEEDQQESESLVSGTTGSSKSHQRADSGPMDALHYFGVYDGHGGAEAAKHCAARMHHVLLECIRTALDGDEAALAGVQPLPSAQPAASAAAAQPSSSGQGAGLGVEKSQSVSGSGGGKGNLGCGDEGGWEARWFVGRSCKRIGAVAG